MAAADVAASYRALPLEGELFVCCTNKVHRSCLQKVGLSNLRYVCGNGHDTVELLGEFQPQTVGELEAGMQTESKIPATCYSCNSTCARAFFKCGNQDNADGPRCTAKTSAGECTLLTQVVPGGVCDVRGDTQATLFRFHPCGHRVSPDALVAYIQGRGGQQAATLKVSPISGMYSFTCPKCPCPQGALRGGGSFLHNAQHYKVLGAPLYNELKERATAIAASRNVLVTTTSQAPPQCVAAAAPQCAAAAAASSAGGQGMAATAAADPQAPPQCAAAGAAPQCAAAAPASLAGGQGMAPTAAAADPQANPQCGLTEVVSSSVVSSQGQECGGACAAAAEGTPQYGAPDAAVTQAAPQPCSPAAAAAPGSPQGRAGVAAAAETQATPEECSRAPDEGHRSGADASAGSQATLEQHCSGAPPGQGSSAAAPAGSQCAGAPVDAASGGCAGLACGDAAAGAQVLPGIDASAVADVVGELLPGFSAADVVALRQRIEVAMDGSPASHRSCDTHRQVLRVLKEQLEEKSKHAREMLAQQEERCREVLENLQIVDSWLREGNRCGKEEAGPARKDAGAPKGEAAAFPRMRHRRIAEDRMRETYVRQEPNDSKGRNLLHLAVNDDEVVEVMEGPTNGYSKVRVVADKKIMGWIRSKYLFDCQDEGVQPAAAAAAAEPSAQPDGGGDDGKWQMAAHAECVPDAAKPAVADAAAAAAVAEPSAAAAAAPAEPSALQAKPMQVLCIHCKSPCESAHKFCCHCGHAIGLPSVVAGKADAPGLEQELRAEALQARHGDMLYRRAASFTEKLAPLMKMVLPPIASTVFIVAAEMVKTVCASKSADKKLERDVQFTQTALEDLHLAMSVCGEDHELVKVLRQDLAEMLYALGPKSEDHQTKLTKLWSIPFASSRVRRLEDLRHNFTETYQRLFPHIFVRVMGGKMLMGSAAAAAPPPPAGNWQAAAPLADEQPAPFQHGGASASSAGGPPPPPQAHAPAGAERPAPVQNAAPAAAPSPGGAGQLPQAGFRDHELTPPGAFPADALPAVQPHEGQEVYPDSPAYPESPVAWPPF